MFQQCKQQFECDHCRRLIPKSTPVRFHQGPHGPLHFCTPECMYDYLDKLDEDRTFSEAVDHAKLAGLCCD
jgi:hypothetical protein